MGKTFRYMIPMLKRGLRQIAAGIFVLIIVDALQLVIPKITQYAIDHMGRPGFTRFDLLKIAGLILLLTAVIYWLKYLWRIFLMGNAWGLERDLRMHYYSHLTKLSQNFFNYAKTGDLMALATNDLNAVRMMFGFGLVAAADTLFISISAIIFMVTIDWKLTMLAILPLPLLSIFISIMGRKIHLSFDRVQASFADLSGDVQESISGIRVVKAFCQEDSELAKMNRFSLDYVKRNISLVRLAAIFHPFLGFIINISMGLVLIFGGIDTIRGDITIGECIAFFSYLGMLVWPMIAIGRIVNLYQTGTASLKRLNEIFDTPPEIADDSSVDSSITTLQGDVEVRDLHFRYRDDLPWVLSGISFHIPAGHTLAVVGRTGCGKSTLIALLERVYNPPRGSIYYDGRDVFSIPLKTLRDQIAIVPQDIFLFSETIENNIRFGRPEASHEEVVKAATMASIHQEILDFEHGYDTMVGERGVTLSGGQKQRIAMARAFLSDPVILILDDSLSAVDTKTERDILQQLVQYRKGRSTIIIAHRVSSIQHANHIIVVRDGKIAEEGTHEELLNLGRLYFNLHEKQQIEERLKERS